MNGADTYMSDCTLCPRRCHVNRQAGQTGYCRETSKLAVARAALHMWEETCISGKNGSGAVFFSGCNMRCVFCQNYNISGAKTGKLISAERLSEIFLELKEQGAHNINLVTPTHYVPQIAEALDTAKRKGLNIPIVYNTSGYECKETLRMLEGYVDVYLPDFKYWDEEIARRLSHAPDYTVHAKQALEEMVRQTGGIEIDKKSGLIKRGVIVRHLVLPGHVKDSKEIISYLHGTYGNQIMISIMNQYTPMPQAEGLEQLGRRVTKKVYKKVVDHALEIGVENGYVQEGGTASESFIPEFDGEGV